MNKKEKSSRKSFLKNIGAASAGMIGFPYIMGSSKSKSDKGIILLEAPGRSSIKYSKNDQIQIAVIGAGKMGQGNVDTALEIEGVKLIAACDLYDSRLERCKERFGEDIFITTDYREILNRDDVDAVIIATPDHWHSTIAMDALNSGKAVYLEKPMIQHIEEGYGIVEAAERTSLPLIVGSTSTSSIVYKKARDLLQQGEIGELNFVESYYDRYSALDAWQYSIPPSASTENIAWNTFLKDHTPVPFDPKRFFWWRNYQDYGTGVAGDLFVHLFSGIHMVTGSNGPDRIMATGGLRYWKDGRDVPDLMTGMYDYPESDSHPAFTLTMRVNFTDGSGGGRSIRFIGSEGEITIAGNGVTLRKNKLSDKPGMIVWEFGEKVQNEYRAYYEMKYADDSQSEVVGPNVFTYRAPEGYSSRYDHFKNLFDAMRYNRKIFQDSKFGLRAAAPALASNLSYFNNRIVSWDPDEMKLL